MEWLESKEKTNRVNVKHKIGDLGKVDKDSAVTVRFNSCRYQVRVVDLSDWKPPKQCRKRSILVPYAKGFQTRFTYIVYVLSGGHLHHFDWEVLILRVLACTGT